eukprot:6052493-Lingulodinium_polyedra.AAC.1
MCIVSAYVGSVQARGELWHRRRVLGAMPQVVVARVLCVRTSVSRRARVDAGIVCRSGGLARHQISTLRSTF